MPDTDARVVRTEVVLLGDLNVDLHLDIPAYPAPGGDGVATRQRTGFGGSAANTAVMLTRLGVRAALVACVGDDDRGAEAISGLAAEGVDTGFVRRSGTEATSLNVITVTPDGERTMFAYRGASAELRVADVPTDLAGAAHLHVSGYALLAEPQRSAAQEAARRARAAGMTVSLDVPVDPVSAVPAVLRDFLRLVDVVVVGAADARRLTTESDDEAAARAILVCGPSVVALTGGSAGSLLCTASGAVRAPVPTVRPVDTTGAGDSFCAGLIAGLLRGATDPMVVGALANTCGAAAVAVPGAGAGLPGIDGIRAALEDLPAPVRDAVGAVLSPRTGGARG
ncbi:carbohydrate kinase family protein [Microbacterium resistens]|uniref:carbohydrate kinase family protein n=1 Tax=Microbacterium resistens TaxID=156977 RepID=UPI003670692E